MGVPVQRANIDIPRLTNNRGGFANDSPDVLSSVSSLEAGLDKPKDPSVLRPGKLKRPPRRSKQQQKNKLHHRHQQHFQRHQQAPVPDTGSSLNAAPRYTSSLPLLVQRRHQDNDSRMMPNRPAHGSGPQTDSEPQANLHSPTTSHSGDVDSRPVDRWSHESTAPGKAGRESKHHDHHVNEQEEENGEEEAIRRGLDDLLARPPPNFDHVHSDGGETRHRSSQTKGRKDTTASDSLPGLSLSRGESHDDSGGGDGCHAVHGDEMQRGNTGSLASGASKITTAETRRAPMPTRSQSGRLFRPAPFSSVGSASRVNAAGYGGTDSAASAGGASTAKNAMVAASFKGDDAVLLNQAFAFAASVAKEEEATTQDRTARGGRKMGRDGGGSATRLPLHSGGNVGRLRRTRSSGSSLAAAGGDLGRSRVEVGRIEAEDWVRGLPRSSSVPDKQLQHLHQSSDRSINQASTTRGHRPGRAERGQQANASGRKTLVVGSRRKEEAGSGALQFDRRRDKKESRNAEVTAELVRRFEDGTGVAALRAELEESRASMRRSAEAIEQVASRWRQQRSMPLSVRGT